MPNQAHHGGLIADQPQRTRRSIPVTVKHKQCLPFQMFKTELLSHISSFLQAVVVVVQSGVLNG
jgi:hypothetical protein